MLRPHYLLFGLVAYLLAIKPMIYLVGFLANFAVPKSVDSGPTGPLSVALMVDCTLLLSFGVVHSLLARQSVKAFVTRWLPNELERSFYSLIAGLQIVLLLWQWRPVQHLVWQVESPLGRGVVWALCAAGWATVVAALLSIRNTHLFGLRQAWAAARCRPYVEPEIAARGPYHFVRHPLYSGTIVALFATPDMSAGHLLLATLFTIYIWIGMRFEERDLERKYGEAWSAYRKRVPALIPRLWPRSSA